jgi:hypothetical protein
MNTCKSLKLNPMTNPFAYILVSGWDSDDGEKLILYATRNCTDQLRSVYGASDVPGSLKRECTETELTAEIAVVGRNGRVSTDVGVIPMVQYSRKRGAYKLDGRSLANAKMHVVTKARRRATLALYGLGGIVDESELDTMNVIGGVTREGRIFRYVSQAQPGRVLDDNAAHGHAPGSDRAKIAEAQLAKVEAADKEFQSGRHPAESRQAPASKPAESSVAEGKLSGKPPSANVDSRERVEPSPRQAPSPANREPHKQDEKPTTSQLNRFNDNPSDPIPKARIPHKITEVRWTKNSKGLVVTLDTGHQLYCFDNRRLGEAKEETFNLLLNGVGKLAIFTTKSTAKDGKTYFNITAILRLGDREWLEDGTPVLRRTREPGED